MVKRVLSKLGRKINRIQMVEIWYKKNLLSNCQQLLNGCSTTQLCTIVYIVYIVCSWRCDPKQQRERSSANPATVRITPAFIQPISTPVTWPPQSATAAHSLPYQLVFCSESLSTLRNNFPAPVLGIPQVTYMCGSCVPNFSWNKETISAHPWPWDRDEAD